jgi:alpha-tubulin suppressor-like RCC1 family protein
VAVRISKDGAPLTEVKAITAGADHSLALTGKGTVLAWGRNDNGQLGDGTTDQRNTPVAVCKDRASLSGVKAIAAGNSHSLALMNDGTALAWGTTTWARLSRDTLVMISGRCRWHLCPV